MRSNTLTDTKAYEDEIAGRDDLEIRIPKKEMDFDTDGNLKPFMADA